MRRRGVAIVTLWGLVACGRDPILEKAEAEAAARAEARGGGAPADGPPPGGTVGGIPGAAQPGDPGGGAPGDPGGGDPGAAGGALGPDGQPLPGQPAEPTPGVPDQPPPGVPGSPPAATPGAIPSVAPGAPRPGVPTEPAPGVPTQPAPGQGGGGPTGPTVAVSGEIVFSAYKGGRVKITVFDGDHASAGGKRPNVVGMGELDRPGPFSVNVAENAGKVYIEASVDEDGDGRPGPLDPQGKADRFPVTVGNKPVSGLAITLSRRAPPPGGRGEDF